MIQYQAGWDAKINGVHPRLFFGPEELKAVRSGFGGNRYHDLVTKDLAGILPKPVPAYVAAPFDAKLGHPGNSSELWERAVGDDIVLLAFATLMDDSPALRQRLRDEVIQACHYPTWGNDPGFPNGDLACAHVIRAVAIAWDWHPDIWSPEDRKLILEVVGQRAGQLLAGLYGQTYWSNHYVENHNNVSVGALGLCGLAFFDDIPGAPEWLAAARLNFQNVARFSASDGSSPEGVSYWSYGMSFIMQYIEGTSRVIDSADLYKSLFLQHAAQYRLYSSTPDLLGTLPWGDSVAQDYYGPRFFLHRLARQYGDGSAEWLAESIPFTEKGGSDAAVWCVLWGNSGVVPVKPRTTDFHFPEADIVTTRSNWGTGGYLLTLKSGFNNRNHCHLDAGALALSFNSDWLLSAPRYGSNPNGAYWRPEGPRWQFYCTSTESHSALLINGTNERSDPAARGTTDQYLSTPGWCLASVDLSQAYKGVTAVRRTVLHARNDYILVMDAVSAPGPVTVDWLAQIGAGSVVVSESNALRASLGTGQLRLEMLSPAERFTTRKPAAPIVDKPAKFINTYTVSQKSSSAAFAALLQPGPAGVSLPVLQREVVEDTADKIHIVIHGSSWSDDVTWSPGQTPLDVVLPGEAGGMVRAGTVAVRTGPGALEGVCAGGVREIRVPPVHFTSARPCEIALAKAHDGSWVMDADRDVRGDIVCSPGYNAQPVAGEGSVCRLIISRR